MEGIAIGAATEDDFRGVIEIYHQYVRETAHTFDLEEKPFDEWRRWLLRFDTGGRHRLYVARDRGAVCGYTLSDMYRERAAYDSSVLTSVYIAPDHVGRGIGTALYRTLLSSLEGEDVHRAYAAIALPNPGSVRLHERFGFVQRGHFSEQGRKFGRYWDVAWYERRFHGS